MKNWLLDSVCIQLELDSTNVSSQVMGFGRALGKPILHPNVVPIRRRSAAAKEQPFVTVVKLLPPNIRHRKMSHANLIANEPDWKQPANANPVRATPEKGEMEAKIAPCSLEMAVVIPPFVLELWMRAQIEGSLS
jgi:hypothetical protein